MRVWKWRCLVHDLSLLTMQTEDNPPAECSGLAYMVWPDDGLCIFDGEPVLAIYAMGPP